MVKHEITSKRYNLRNKNNLKKGSSDLHHKTPPCPSSDSDEESLYDTCSETEEESVNIQPKKRNNKNIIESDSEEHLSCDSDEQSDFSDDYFCDERKQMRKFLNKKFPSKYMNEKVKKDNTHTKSKSNKTKKTSTKPEKTKHKPHKNRKYAEESDEDSDQSDYSSSSCDEEEEKQKHRSNKGEKYNIIFSINDKNNYDDDDEDDEFSDDDNDTVESSNSENDEKIFMKEHYLEIEDTEKIGKEKEKDIEDKKHSDKSKKKESIKDIPQDIESEYLELQELKKYLINKLSKKPKSTVLKNAIEECKETIKDLVFDARIKNTKEFHKLINKGKRGKNEVDYFKKKMSNLEQLKVMKELKEINDHIYIEKPYRLALLESKMPAKFKAIALQKLNVLKSMEPGDPEYYKIKNWVETFMRIPFCQEKNLSVNIKDGLDKCHEFMNNSKQILDDCVYGLDDAKLQIMQLVGQWIANPSAVGTAIAIHGPKGCGKTSLVKDGISKILGREFTFIALGGASDASFLEGHSYTYEGSSWGKIVQILIESKCMNPVIYFDELDKVSDTARGQEIIGILTHLTDTTQNNEFHDKYFSEFSFDLSKCLFIFSYNDESLINPILRDRMYPIKTKGYETKEKMIIARDFLLPKIREQVNFDEKDIIIPDDTLNHIITNQALSKGEEGVRNLKRCLEIIYTKLNLFRLVKTEDNFMVKNMNIKVEFPFTVLKSHVDILIKNHDSVNQSVLAMYV